MKVTIDTSIRGENGGYESWKVVLNQDELTDIIRTEGIDAGNKALTSFVDKFVGQFREKLSAVINR
ncbi:MAG: hypothetical protein EBU90_03280 [Proteobacteria bacterium]|nr:hypothetical protein [Pseudomonadota bacterium]NBP13349.1 hypothetical protein [bacterium]